MNESEARELIVEVGRLMYERSYVVSSDGNVSVRLDDGRILATPTMTSKGRMAPECLALTDIDGNPLNDKRASSELAMHLLIYKMRDDVNAVCHAHPPHGTAYAVAGMAIEQPILSEVILTLGCVPLTEYGTPSTSELTDSMRPYVTHHNALLMANHGAVAYGKNIWEAWDRMETLEHTAKIGILARQLGNVNDLPSGAIEKLVEIREKAGYLGPSARCQSCGYLENTSIECSLEGHDATSEKVSMTRGELQELLERVAGIS
ncbi:MAG: class II aldolase/adducin family protein [Pyrinomonadaceae bacterium]